MARYVPRLADRLIEQRLAAFPALLLTGPRACGKTTTAIRHASTVVRLDVPGQAGVVRADPDAALRSFAGRPLLIDEWQEVPEVIGAVKRAVDAGAPPGSFLLTGSVQAPLTAEAWPATGRVSVVDLGLMSVRERLARVDRPGLIGRIEAGGLGPEAIPDAPDLTGYVDLALRGGFPDAALMVPDRARSAWYASYVDHLARRDLRAVAARADPDRLRTYLEALALNSAGVVDHSTIFTAAGINRKTADRYDDILARLFLTTRLPAWSHNRLAGLTALPKRYLNDAALLAACARITRSDVLRDSGLLGRLIDTFVHAQLRAEIAAEHPVMRLSHLRTANGRQEVDLVLELGGRRVVGIEVKCTAAPDRDDARHLRWLRDGLGEDFVAGIVLHTGGTAFPLGERIVAMPICAIWT